MDGSSSDSDSENNSQKTNQHRSLLLAKKRRLEDEWEDIRSIVQIADASRKRIMRLVETTQRVPQERLSVSRPPVSESPFYNYMADPDALYRNATRGSYYYRQFQHYFRMHWRDLDALFSLAISQDWFPSYDSEHLDKRLVRRYPLKMLIMCALVVLSKTASFKALGDLAYIPETTLRMFFDNFVEVGRTKMRSAFIQMPVTMGDLRSCEMAYKLAGFPGCVASVDGVRIQLWSCPFNVRHQFIGKEKYPALTFIVAVSYDGRALYVSDAYRGNQPDTEIALSDELFSIFAENELLTQFPWTFVRPNGTIGTRFGARLLADNGFPLFPFMTVPATHAANEKQCLFNRMVESLRKDVERAFGDIKARFPMLKFGLTVQRLETAEAIVLTCFALRNYILKRNPRLLKAVDLSSNAGLAVRLRRDPDFRPVDPPRNTRKPLDDYVAIRNDMVEHFDILQRAGLLRWPRLEIMHSYDFDDSDEENE